MYKISYIKSYFPINFEFKFKDIYLMINPGFFFFKGTPNNPSINKKLPFVTLFL